jgi:3-oxoacyl-(acyl-carrier-protein) synthase
MNDSVVITGLGAVSAAGLSLARTLESFERQERNIGPVSLFSSSLTHPAFEVKGLAAWYDLPGQRTLGLCLAALDEALADAGLGDPSSFRVGVCLGTTVASQLNDLAFYKTYRNTGEVLLEPVDRFLKGNLADQVGRRLKVQGPRMTVVNACSSGTDAIGVGLGWLKAGLCDIAICGGADELNHVPYVGFASLGIMNPDPCSPFDRDRQGLNLGEGAGIVVLEKQSIAKQRGRKAAVSFCGYGSCADAYHLTAPRPDGAGLSTALAAALNEAGIMPRDVAFVNAHGTGTKDNDLVEGNTLARVFGKDLVMLSTKGYTGHTLGAAGGLEAVFTAAALREGWVPASAGFANRDEAISLEPIQERTAVTGRYALSTSLAFGGNNAVIVLRREEGA